MRFYVPVQVPGTTFAWDIKSAKNKVYYLLRGKRTAITFHEHPEEIGEAKVMEQCHQDDAAHHSRVDGDLCLVGERKRRRKSSCSLPKVRGIHPLMNSWGKTYLEGEGEYPEEGRHDVGHKEVRVDRVP